MRANSAAWWWRGVIYQCYPRSFQESDGGGDLPGITARLDELAWDGVDAVWLCPLFLSPGAALGDDVSNDVGVDPRSGAMAEFDRLLARAHELGHGLVVAVIPNHTSDQPPSFRAPRSFRDNPKHYWYTWREPKPDGSPASNRQAIFEWPSWTFDETFGEYDMHSFPHERNVVTLRENPRSARALTRRPFELRRARDTPSTGARAVPDGLPERVLGYERSSEAERFAAVLNREDWRRAGAPAEPGSAGGRHGNERRAAPRSWDVHAGSARGGDRARPFLTW